jgi:hypothetical protein
MGQMFVERYGCMTFDPDGVARVLKPRFCYKHLTHSGSVNRYKYAIDHKFEYNEQTYTLVYATLCVLCALCGGKNTCGKKIMSR